jgi:hypothetical protein
MVRSGQHVLFVNFPFDINMKAISDIITVGIYGVVLVLNAALFVLWQKRGQEKEAPADEAPKKSRFGRPLRRRSAATAAAGASTNGGDA